MSTPGEVAPAADSVNFVFFHGRSLMSRVIRFFTRSKVSHVAFMLSDGRLIETWNHDGGFKTWWDYSSFERHSKGTLVSVVSLKTPEAQKITDGFIRLADSREPYNWLGVFDFAIKLLPETSRGKSFCSEGAYRVLAEALGHSSEYAALVSPDNFRMLLMTLGGRHKGHFLVGGR